MTIDVSLDVGAITDLIGRLNPNRFQETLEELVDVLSIEGAGIASSAYGSMAGAIGVRDSEGQGTASAHIETIAADEDLAWIAEFGAGDDTITVSDYFDSDNAYFWDLWVFPGAYSLFKGSMQYWKFHHWQFGGQWYEGVPARQGLYHAKEYIKQHYADIAGRVIRFD